MTVIINKNVESITSLSTEAQLVLQLIPEGERWFGMSNQDNSPTFYFDSEVDFLSAVLDGLHSTDLIYLNQADILVAPQRLISLSVQNLQLLLDAEESGKNKKGLTTMLKKAGLLTNDQLKQEQNCLLSPAKLENNSLFCVMSLHDLCAIYALATDKQYAEELTAKVNIEASKFALSIAQTPAEFCNLYQFYLQVVKSLDLEGISQKIRYKRVSECYEALISFALDMLACPQISGLTNAEHVNEAIQTWSSFGSYFGFSSSSVALLALAENVSLTDLANQPMIGQVTDYRQKMIDLIEDSTVSEPTLSQDGQFLSYVMEHSVAEVLFCLSKTGCLSLEKFNFQ